MLIKQITSGNNYEKSLKVRRNISFALLIIGLVGEACYFLLVDGSDLPDFARGFYMGAASGICLGAVMLLVRTQYLLSHPDEQKKARISLLLSARYCPGDCKKECANGTFSRRARSLATYSSSRECASTRRVFVL